MRAAAHPLEWKLVRGLANIGEMIRDVRVTDV
jgi:hypothetical protein